MTEPWTDAELNEIIRRNTDTQADYERLACLGDVPPPYKGVEPDASD